MGTLTHYDTLGVKPEASAEDIKRAYRRLAAKTHPDVGGEMMAPLFLTVQAAFEALGTQARRDAYDYTLRRDSPAGDTAPEPDVRGDGPDAVQPERPAPASAAVAESTVRARVPAVFWLSLILWAALLPVLLLSETPTGLLAETGSALPAGAGTLIYAGLWLAGLIHSLTGRTGKASSLPLLALAAGAGSALWLHAGAEILAALHTAAGLGLTAAAASLARRRRNLARMGITPKGVPRVLTFSNTLNTNDTAAQRRTYRSFGALLTQPGTRILESVSVGGRVLQFLIVNGDRAAVVDSRAVPGWLLSAGSDLESSFESVKDGLRTTVRKDLATLGWLPSADRAGWVAVHPATTGSVRLSDADGSRVSACAPAAVAEDLYQWFAGGSRYGVVDPCFLYRLVHEGASPLRDRRI